MSWFLPLWIIGGLIAAIVFLTKTLFTSMKKYPDEHAILETTKNVSELAEQIRQVTGELGANIERIQENPLGNSETAEKIAVAL